MSKLNQPEINTSISSKTPLKIWQNLNKELKFYKINLKSWKTKALKSIKQFKITIISNSSKFTKEIKPKPSLTNTNWKRNKRKNLLIKISMKFKNLTWLFYLSKKICKASGFNMKKLVKTETTLVFNSLIEMMNFAFFIKNLMCKRTFFVNLKLRSKISKMISEWSSLKLMNSKEKLLLDSKNFHQFPSLLKNFCNCKDTSKIPIKSKVNFQANFKILPIKIDGENWADKIQMNKLLMPKSVFLKKGWTAKNNNFWKKNWF